MPDWLARHAPPTDQFATWHFGQAVRESGLARTATGTVSGVPGSANPAVPLVGSRDELVRELHVDRETVDWEGFDTTLSRPVVVRLLRAELTHDTLAIERFWQAARAAGRMTSASADRVLDAGNDPESAQPFVVRAAPFGPPSTPDQPPVMAPSASVLAPSRLRRLDSSRRWLTLSGVGVLLVLVFAALQPGVGAWLDWVNTPSARLDGGLVLPPASAATAVAPPTAPVAGRSIPAPTAPTPIPTRVATATTVPSGQSRRIVNTDGQGVALRATAGGDRLPGKGYDEGATVEAFEQSGAWTRIRGNDGREGWVLSVTLAP